MLRDTKNIPHPKCTKCKHMWWVALKSISSCRSKDVTKITASVEPAPCSKIQESSPKFCLLVAVGAEPILLIVFCLIFAVFFTLPRFVICLFPFNCLLSAVKGSVHAKADELDACEEKTGQDGVDGPYQRHRGKGLELKQKAIYTRFVFYNTSPELL